MQPFRDIPLPAKLGRRPKDPRGYPIPASVLIDKDGRPDFRITDAQKWHSLYQSRCCGLCGEPLGRHLAFIGGPLSHQSRLFTDLPMHRECAHYAIQVCPYLAAPHFKYAETTAIKTGVPVHVTDAVSPHRPERFFLSITKNCQLLQSPENELFIQAFPWEQTEWWIEGVLSSTSEG